ATRQTLPQHANGRLAAIAAADPPHRAPPLQTHSSSRALRPVAGRASPRNDGARAHALPPADVGCRTAHQTPLLRRCGVGLYVPRHAALPARTLERPTPPVVFDFDRRM
ncbi:MAG: hypothetical protein AVDCRST_MAG26-4295, partial [uncultured Chloroflexia bacterium]